MNATVRTTGIEWTETTWNPTTGCDRISPGCDHCYALTMAKRLRAMGSAKYQTDGHPRTSGPGFGLTLHQQALTEPLRWRRPRLVFVNSMSDLGHARVPREFLAEIFGVMATAHQHTFQILTKRPGRLAKILSDNQFQDQVAEAAAGRANATDPPDTAGARDSRWPLPNVWIGTSIESDEYCWRADELRKTPAAVRFLSCEPLLGPLPNLDLTGIDWAIVGGESGPEARPMRPDWVRALCDQSVAAGVAFFFKQWGGRTPKQNGRDLDGVTWDQYPPRRQ
ncbi:phage Gp37/Gp68 family protein [Nocardia sp. NPDC051981]|uniref:DUF5131 family protein n=1 Tax=Nocardia sp. NPDC051981 TaxID=3155417 RepID=UPI0034352894